MIAGLSKEGSDRPALSGLYTSHIGLLAMCNSSPGYVYSDQTVKKLMVFPVFSNRLQKKAGGETFYALANQGKA